jgi:hypothetical protein
MPSYSSMLLSATQLKCNTIDALDLKPDVRKFCELVQTYIKNSTVCDFGMERDLDDKFEKVIAAYSASDLATLDRTMDDYPDDIQECISEFVLDALDNGSTQLPKNFEEKRASFESILGTNRVEETVILVYYRFLSVKRCSRETYEHAIEELCARD